MTLSSCVLWLLRDVSIRMETKNLRRIHQWKCVNVVQVILDGLLDGNGIAFVKLEGWFEHSFKEPQLLMRRHGLCGMTVSQQCRLTLA